MLTCTQSDEDDDWGDTIDFGDGTKVTIGHTPAAAADEPIANDYIEAAETVGRESLDSLPAIEIQPRSAGNPWKQPERPSAQPLLPADDFPLVNAPPQSANHRSQRPSTFDLESRPHAGRDPLNGKVRSPLQEFGYEPRARSGSFKDGRMQMSGDARYQYEQNTFDRHWQSPLPQTREIYNSTTGRFEQIDATQKQGRRPSHHDRKSADILQRPQLMSGDARRSVTHAVSPAAAALPPVQADQSTTAAPDLFPTDKPSDKKSPDVAVAPEPAAPIQTKPEVIDPSSQEFIVMQKKLMAERREQAIQRRKDQEAEELARKERARKKAEELMKLAEKEKQEEKAKQAAEVQAPVQPRIMTRRSMPVVESNTADQKATSDSLHSAQSKRVQDDRREQAGTKTLWQRGAVLPAANPDVRANHQSRKAQFDRRDAFESDPESASNKPSNSNGGEQPVVSRNVWGPIGPKTSTSAPILGSFGLGDDLSASLARESSAASRPQSATRSKDQVSSSPSWSAFDGITQPRKIAQKPVEAREYNVFDAADEVITPEKLRQSPAGQSQANRTSSRFFPSPSGPIAPKTLKGLVPFVSPEIPPLIDSEESVYFEPLDTPPALSLPTTPLKRSDRQRQQGRSIDQIIASIRGDPDAAAQPTRHGGRAWVLDTQTRSVWEVKPMKDGHSPKIRVPRMEKTLDWTRKERPVLAEPLIASTPPEKLVTASTVPLEPAWSLPKNLETTSKTSSIPEPLIPPKPSLRLPETSDQTVSPLQGQKMKTSRFDDRVNRYFTTRSSLEDELDSMTPIRIKTSEIEVKVQRKFGRRVETPKKKVADVKRQPVNMSDAPGGSGFKRGFANRVRQAAPTDSTPPSPMTNSASKTHPTSDQSSTPTRIAPGSLSMNGPKITVVQRPSDLQNATDARLHSPSAVSRAREQQQPSPSFSRPPSLPTQSSSSHISSPVQYMHQQPQISLVQSPMVSRVAPPGLSAPVMNGDNSKGQGNMMTQSPAPVARGPPGIVLP